MIIPVKTKKEYFLQIIDILEKSGFEDLVDVMKREVLLLDKKRTKVKRKNINDIIGERILALLQNGPLTATEIMYELQIDDLDLDCLSLQRINHVLRYLGKDCRQVNKTLINHKAYFSLGNGKGFTDRIENYFEDENR